MRSSHTLFAISLAIPVAASATVFTGTFTLPSATGPTSAAPGVAATLATVGGNHTGTWAPPASSPWLGTYNGTGPIPSGASGSPATLDFTTLTNSTVLPSGTFVLFSDLDSTENLTLIGYDAAGSVLQTPWLSDLVFVGGANPADFIQAYMASWSFDDATGIYSIQGETAAGNPTLLAVATTTQNLSRIDLTKNASFGFSLNAVAAPEPASMALAGLGFIALGLARGRRRHGGNASRPPAAAPEA